MPAARLKRTHKIDRRKDQFLRDLPDRRRFKSASPRDRSHLGPRTNLLFTMSASTRYLPQGEGREFQCSAETSSALRPSATDPAIAIARLDRPASRSAYARRLVEPD